LWKKKIQSINIFLPPTKYNSKRAVNTFLTNGNLLKVGELLTRIEDMDALSLNYWLSKFVMEVAEKEWSKVSFNDCVWHRMRNPTLP